MANKKLSQLMLKLAEYRLFLPPDIYERHKFIGSKVFEQASILDVGGSLSRLSEFCRPSKIVTADIKPPADIVYDGKRIPVDDSSFDVITSIDVLEHVPKQFREPFFEELYRVTKKRIIISAPYGTPEHIAYEKRLLKENKDKGIQMPYLEEHVEIGLPTPEELEVQRKKFGGKMYYSGNLHYTEKLVRIHNFEVRNTFFNFIFFFLKLGFNCFVNIFLYFLIVNRPESNKINRFYLIIDKAE